MIQEVSTSTLKRELALNQYDTKLIDFQETAKENPTYLHPNSFTESIEKGVFDSMNEHGDSYDIEQDPYFVSISAEYHEPNFAFSINDTPIMPLGDITVYKGKPKQGKSKATIPFVTAALNGHFGNLKSNLPPNSKVLVFDTEQNKINVQNAGRRIYDLCGWNKDRNSERLLMYTLRAAEKANRLSIIKNKIDEHKPTFVVIDGLVDLIHDFNDVKSSSELVDEIQSLAVAYDCCICFVMHTNKAKEDSNMRGHLGTIAEQKCSDVFLVEKENSSGKFKVSHTETRNYTADDFYFMLDDEGQPKPVIQESCISNEKSTKDDLIKQNFASCFHHEGEGVQYNELIRRYAAVTGKKPNNSTIKDHINKMVECEFLRHIEDLYYLSKWGD